MPRVFAGSLLSIGAVNIKTEQFSVVGGIGNAHRSAADETIFDIVLLGDRQVEHDRDSFSA
jgi:hypothetical protein